MQVHADEVCGCPLVRDVFEPTGEYCRVSKRKCNKHYCWEKLRRAEVDLERVRVVSAYANESFIWVKGNSCVMINSKPFQDKIALSFISLTVNL